MLTNAFRSVLALAPGDLVAAAYLFTGRVAPDYEGLELNVSLTARFAEQPSLGQGLLFLGVASRFRPCALL